MEADSHEPFRELASAAAAIPLTLSPEARERFEKYVATLLFWRQRLSLTAAATPRQILFDHILDSLFVSPFVTPGMRVADVGSGAGFPGIPLGIVCSPAEVVLIESRRKKANFLREAVRAMQLRNVAVVEQRAEMLGADFREVFDVVVSRAVGSVSALLTVSAPLLKSGGRAIAMKGPKARDAASNDDRFASETPVEYSLPDDARHRLLVFRKR